MKVAIIMGSDSDWKVMKPAEELLLKFGIETEVLVASAHRTPEAVREFAVTAREKGIKSIIAAAGLAAHLGGVIASYTTLPVIGVPISGGPFKGKDALLSFVQMPSGVPVAVMAVDGAKNAAIFAVEMLAANDDSLAEKLDTYREEMKQEVANKAKKLAEMRKNGI